MAMPWHKNPYPGGKEIFKNKLMEGSLILVSDQCQWVEKKNIEIIRFLDIWPVWSCTRTRGSVSGVMTVFILMETSLISYYYCILRLTAIWQGFI